METNYNWNEIRLLIKIKKYSKINEELTCSILARKIGIDERNPIFHRIIKDLKKFGIITEKSRIGNSIILEISYKSLKNLIFSQEEFKENIIKEIIEKDVPTTPF